MTTPDFRYNPYSDDNLSTLSNIRINNRKSKQKLRNKINEDTNTFDFLLNDSPTKTKSPSPLRKSYIPSKSISPLAEKNYDFDLRILDPENHLYTNSEKFQKSSKDNELKRERILRSLEYPLYKSRSNKYSDIPEDTFHKSRLEKDIPDLKPTDGNSRSYTTRPFSSPGTTKSRRYLDGLLNEEKKDEEFQRLLSKYNLKTDDNVNYSDKSKIKDLQNKINILEVSLHQLKTKSENESESNKNFIKKNIQLNQELQELNHYIGFLESNFDKVYKKLGNYKKENQELKRVNTELSKLNDKYRDLLQNSPTNVSEDIKELQARFDENSTTNHLLNMKL